MIKLISPEDLKLLANCFCNSQNLCSCDERKFGVLSKSRHRSFYKTRLAYHENIIFLLDVQISKHKIKKQSIEI